MRVPRRMLSVAVMAAVLCAVFMLSQPPRNGSTRHVNAPKELRGEVVRSVETAHDDTRGSSRGVDRNEWKEPEASPLPHKATLDDATPSTEAPGANRPVEVARSNIALRWSGGGVTGPGAAAVQVHLDALFERTMTASRRGVCGVALSPRGSDHWQQSLAAFRRVFDVLMRNLTVQGLERDDCWIHLTPQQRAMCLMAAAAEGDDDDGAMPLHRRRTYLQSYCSTMVPCLQWQRGTFSMALNATFLERVYAEEVVPQVNGDEENREAIRWLTRNFVQDDASIDAEVKWALDRASRQEEQLGKHMLLFDDFEEAVRAERRGTPFNRSEATRRALEWARKPSDMRPILQGMDVEFDFRQRMARATSPETGEAFSLQHFSSLQTLAILHHKVFVGYHRRKRYGRSHSNDTEDRTSDEPFYRPNMNIVVFSGDSMNREFFLRIVFHIRFGLDPPPGNDYLRQTPFHEPSQQHDMVYSVFPTHDQLDLYHSQMSNARSPHTVQAFFQKLKWDIKRWERNTTATPKPAVALLYVVYFWDPQTEFYRLETVPLHVLLAPTAARHQADILDATFPRNASNAEMFMSEARSQQKRLHWHAQVIPLGNNPCEVSIRMPDGTVKVIDVSLKKVGGRLIPRGSNPHHAQHVLMQQQQVPGICTPERRRSAERIRQNLLRQFHYRFSPKPIVPLRDFGMRIAVHVAGHVFWEYERNPELMQHYFAMMLATDDRMPTLPNFPRRAMPKDQTEMYIFTNSYQENLQPMLRWLSPFYARDAGIAQKEAATKRLLNLSDIGLSDDDGGLQEANALDDEDVAALEAIPDGTAFAADGTPPPVREATQIGDATASPPIAGDSTSLLDRLAALAVSGAAVGKSASDMFLKGLKMPKESRFNLIKNVQLMAWFERVLSLRRKELTDYNEGLGRDRRDSAKHPRHSPWQSARHRSVVPTTMQELHTPFRFVKYVGLLEMAKLQALRFAQGDNRHFSCRYTQVKDRIRFGTSFEPFGIRNVVGLGSYANNTAKTLCGAPATATARATSSSEGAGEAAPPSTPPQTQMLSVEELVKLFARLFARDEDRSPLWAISGMEAAERLLSVAGGTSPSHPIMHFSDYKEYGVIAHDDDDRCVDDGNWFLAEVMLAKMVLRDLAEVEGLQQQKNG